MIQQGWQEQYGRMCRSYAALAEVSTPGKGTRGSDAARDALFHFFQDAYHLKDWIKNDPEVKVPSADVEAAIEESEVLRLCGDLCNGTKHGRLDPRRKHRTGDAGTAFVTQSVVVAVGTVTARAAVGPLGARRAEGTNAQVDAQSVSGPTGFTTHSWEVESNARVWDAAALASQVIDAWRKWLVARGLLSHPT